MERMKLNIQLFGASGSISCTQIGSYNTANNTTTERITFTVTRTSGTTYWSDARTVNFVVGGQSYTSSLALPSSQSSSSCYVDVTVTHDIDGSKYLTYSASIVTGTSAGTVSASGSKWLTTIPRAGSLGLSLHDAKIDNIVIVYPNVPPGTGFTCKISYQRPGDTSWFWLWDTESASTISQEKQFTIPASWLQYFTTSNNATFRIRSDTYNGNSYVGQDFADLIVRARDNTDAPNYTLSISEGNSQVASLGVGSYVQNKSRIRVTLSGISRVYNSPLDELVIVIKDSGGSNIWTKSYEVNETATSISVDTDTLTKVGTYTLYTLLYDKRRVSAKEDKYQSYTSIAYNSPQITSVSVARATSQGIESENGTYLKYTFVSSITSLNNKNTKSWRIYYKQNTTSSFSNYITLTSSTYTLNNVGTTATSITLNTNYIYDIRFEANDAFNIPTRVDRSLGSDFRLMNFNASGKSMALGEISNRGSNETVLDSKLTINCENDLQINRESVKDKLDTIPKTQSFITMCLSSEHQINLSSAWSSRAIQWDKAWINQGGGYLSVDSGYNGIVINSNDISYVQVSAEFTSWLTSGNSGGAVEVHITVNSSDSGICSFDTVSGGTQSIIITSIPIKVSKGDVIGLKVVFSNEGTYTLYGTSTRAATNLTVKVLK